MKRSTMDITLDLVEKYGPRWDIIRFRTQPENKLMWSVRWMLPNVHFPQMYGEWHDFKTVRQLENFLKKETELLKASERRMN